MDGGGRFAGSLTETALLRPVKVRIARAVSQRRRGGRRVRGGVRVAPGRWHGFARSLVRLATHLSRLPRHAGLAATILMIAASAGYGAVRGDQMGSIVDVFKAF